MIAKSGTSNRNSKVNLPGGSETVRDSGVSRASGATFTATGRPIASGQISRNSLMQQSSKLSINSELLDEADESLDLDEDRDQLVI